MPGRALSGPSGGDPAAASRIRDSSVASTLLGARRKAEPPAPAAGTRRGPALRAAAAASSRSGCPSVTGNLLALAARGAGGALRPPRAPGRGAGAAGARRESPQQGRAPPLPARHPRLRGSLRGGPLGPSPCPAPSPAGVYRPHRSPPPLGLFRWGMYF